MMGSGEINLELPADAVRVSLKQVPHRTLLTPPRTLPNPSLTLDL